MNKALKNAKNLYLEGILKGDAKKAVHAYTGARYTQHSTGVADGAEGFIAFFEPFLKRNPIRDIEIVRGWQDGRYVFLQAFQSLNGGESQWLTTDFFDSDQEGKIIEHWDVIAAAKPVNPSGRTQVDGATAITDLDKTEANKKQVESFIETCLIGRDINEVRRFINADTYIQHSPDVGDGVASFESFYGADDCPLSYQECFLTVGSGNFVATLNRAKWESQDLCQVDVFRLEAGLIVEHWDNSERVPHRDTWTNSGKF